MKKIIITGVAGYIGGHLAHFFLKKKYYVLGIDNFYSGEKKLIKSLNKFKNFNFINLDISKKKIQNIKGCYDCIIHLAAQTSVQKSIKNKKETFRINQMTLKNALKIADVTKCKLFFFTSSAAVYGNVKKIPINEKENLKPTNAYGLSKKLNEQQINKFSRKKKIKFVILRLFNIYGKSISNTRNFGVINKYIESIKKKKIIYLHHQGTCTRDFFYIKDLIQVFFIDF
jgi:nucleoside-diphosphate-sugar epimerase